MLLLAAATVFLAPTLGHAAPPRVQATAQIAALQAAKARRSPVQRKISSHLLYETRMRRGLDVAPGVRTLRTMAVVDADGTTLVDVKGEIGSKLLARIEALGGDVISAQLRFGSVRARLHLDDVEALASLPEVRFVEPAGRAYTNKINTSEGDVAHLADQVRSTYGVDGTGIAIGVLSDGVNSLASIQASGDLPATVNVLEGQAGSGDEGTAMLEIVYDLAPGADLYFATAFTSQASFAQNILDLRTAGCDIIVDDVRYFAEGVFQDDDVADSVNAVTAAGALYFSSAGNAGNLNDGTAGVWEGDFVDSGLTIGPPPRPLHDFGGGVIGNVIADPPSPFVPYTLHWSDALGASGNDYDLYLLNQAGTAVLAASTSTQNGNDDPFEAIAASSGDTGRQLAIAKYSGDLRYFHLNANRGELTIVTDGQTSGHSAARDAFSMAAVRDSQAGGPGGTFDGSESVETFSSDGPRRVFYEAGGTPITPGDFSSTGGEVRQKPDLTGADCVSTATPGFATFCGTSASAPHGAAIAALLLELGGPSTAPQQVRDALTMTALDIEAPGTDRDSGAGIIHALAAAQQIAGVECADGVDNDADGFTDDPADPGCDNANDPSENSSSLECDNGLDDDGDGLTDYVFDADMDGISDPPGDPGCAGPTWPSESPQCDDEIDNDSDGGTDWDGGVGGGTADSYCANQPWRMREKPPRRSCGLGFEVALLLAPLATLRRRSRPS